MRRAGKKRGFFYYSWKGLGYLAHGLWRGIGLVFLLLVLLAATAYLGLRAAFDEERIRSVFVAQIQDLLQRPVQIDKVLLEPHGFKLRGLRVMERLDVPGQYLLTSDTVLVTVRLSALLRRRLELDQVRLIAPSIQLIRDEEGLWNIADILTSTRAARAMPVGRFSLPLSLGAGLTRIDQGVLKVEDRLKMTSYRFENVGLALARFDVDRPFSFSASCDNTSSLRGRTVRSSLSLEGVMSLASLDWPQAYLRASRLDLTVDGVLLQGSGGLTGLPPSKLDLEASLPGLGPEVWRRLLGKELDLRLPPGHWQLKAAFPARQRIRVQRLHAECPPLSASVMGTVDLSSGSLSAEASLAQFPLSKVADLYPPWSRFGLRGVLDASLSAAGPWGRLQLRKGNLRVSRAGGRFRDFAVERGDLVLSASDGLDKVALAVVGGQGQVFSDSFSDLSVSASLDNDDLKLDRLSLRFIDSQVALKALVRNLKDPREVEIAGSVDRVRWEEAQALLADFAARISTRTARAESDRPRTWLRTFKYAIPKRFPDTVGHITIGSVAHKNFAFNNVDVLWDIRGVSPTLQRVSGDVRVSFGPGRVADIPAVQASNKFLRIVFLPFIYMHKMNNLSVFSTATAYPKALDFNRIEGEYGLRQGVVTTRLFYVDSPQMVAFTDGTADFGRETVDMNIMTRLTSYRGTLPQWWVDENNRPSIAFRVKGDLSSPDLEPRLSKMAADEIEAAVEDARAKAKKRYAALDKLRRL